MQRGFFNLLAVLFLSVFSSNLAADFLDDCSCARYGVQAALVTGGNASIGVVRYSEMTEAGVTISGHINNARNSTKTVTPAVFGGLRYSLCEGTYFAYGLNFAATFGTIGGHKIRSDVSGGAYISLEQRLTDHLLLVLWVNPYQYEYQKFKRCSVSTQSFFNTGGIGLSYLF